VFGHYAYQTNNFEGQWQRMNYMDPMKPAYDMIQYIYVRSKADKMSSQI